MTSGKTNNDLVGLVPSSDGYSAGQTVFLCSKNQGTRNVVYELCKRHGFKVFDATNSESSKVDWLAIPYFVGVLDISWYVAHQHEIVEYHKTGANDAVELVIGDGVVAVQDPRYFVQLSTAELNSMDKLITREKHRFDQNVRLVGL